MGSSFHHWTANSLPCLNPGPEVMKPSIRQPLAFEMAYLWTLGWTDPHLLLNLSLKHSLRPLCLSWYPRSKRAAWPWIASVMIFSIINGEFNLIASRCFVLCSVQMCQWFSSVFLVSLVILLWCCFKHALLNQYLHYFLLVFLHINNSYARFLYSSYSYYYNLSQFCQQLIVVKLYVVDSWF